MDLRLLKVEEKDLIPLKRDMQEAFQLGAIEGNYEGDTEAQILPDEDIEHSLHTEGAVAYKAVDEEGTMLGGAIVVINEETGENHLDFLYVKHGVQSKGIGKFIWFELEKLYPNTKVWKTCTPYFEKRNIHFYVNVCRFHIVDFYNPFHPDPEFPEDAQNEGG
ncbi:MAG: GNAT family N-acetyltransferase [Eubacteriales bacterium]|nr:GNAT family N-acetyltransferase [Eubacteriales bacterium]